MSGKKSVHGPDHFWSELELAVNAIFVESLKSLCLQFYVPSEDFEKKGNQGCRLLFELYKNFGGLLDK